MRGSGRAVRHRQCAVHAACGRRRKRYVDGAACSRCEFGNAVIGHVEVRCGHYAGDVQHRRSVIAEGDRHCRARGIQHLIIERQSGSRQRGVGA